MKKSMKKKIEFRDHQEKLLQDLKDPELATAYLNVALMDEDPRMFLIALKNVNDAWGIQMTDLARTTKLSRENLYKILSKKGNPTLTSLVSLLNATGFALSVQRYKR
jgi:probable addiction module antidote protein